jgi:predicted amidophosphoribosyltransferase
MRRLPPQPVVLSGVPTWAPVAYEGTARDLVRALKFRSALKVADTMAALIAAGPREALPASVTLVPVPLHPRRLRRRGFSQTVALARALARRTALPVTDCLARSGDPLTQVGRRGSERRAGPAGHVRARPNVPLPAHALLVDDVATTGATLAACAAALRAVGTSEPRAVTFARTLGW